MLILLLQEEGIVPTYADQSVKTILSTAGLTGMTAATETIPPFDGNIILGPELSTAEGAPGKAIFILGVNGGIDDPFLGVNTHHKREFVQVVVRGDVSDYEGGLTLARAVRAALHYPTPATYYQISVLDPQPTYGGRDEDGRHIWSMTVELRSAA